MNPSVPVPPRKSTSNPPEPLPVVSRQGNPQDWAPFDRALARDGSVDPTDKAVYAALASFIDPTTGRSAPSEAVLGSSDVPDDVPTRKRLAACIGRTMQTVDRSIKRLEAMGAIRVDRRVHPDNPKLPIPSVYELLPYKPQPPLVQKPVIPGPRKRLPISATKRARILDRDGHRCRKCGVAEDLTIDHVLHWSRGGSNADDNLRVLCRSCNSRRHDGDLEGIDS